MMHLIYTVFLFFQMYFDIFFNFSLQSSVEFELLWKKCPGLIFTENACILMCTVKNISFRCGDYGFL